VAGRDNGWLHGLRWAVGGLWAQAFQTTDPRTPFHVTHPALLRVPALHTLTQHRPVWTPWPPRRGTPVLGWGYKRTGRAAQAHAARHTVWLAEEGFLKGTARRRPALQVLIDTTGGMHYDPAQPSTIDAALDAADTPQVRARARALMATIRQAGLSKINARRDPGQGDLPNGPFVLVVDQVAGDDSLPPSRATPERFALMLNATLCTWPNHRVVVRTHPDLHDRGRGGHYHGPHADPRVTFHAGDDHPAAWLRAADHVVVMSSQMGFEALIHGTPVTCWGVPFYAARGLTRDMGAQPGHMRRACDLEQLVGAALIVAPTSLNPATMGPGTPEQIVAHLAAHRTAVAQDPTHACAIGFSKRKWKALRRFMPATTWLEPEQALAHPGAVAVLWGLAHPPKGWGERPVVRVEDGFLRSKGLGAAFTSAFSWIVDPTGGIHYDPTRPSHVENSVLGYEADKDGAEATVLLETLRRNKTTKYNLPERAIERPMTDKPVVLVVGQVENDASLRAGSPKIRTNADLLRAARAAWPDAFLLYRPHPDVVAGLRPGDWRADGLLADAVEPHAGTIGLIGVADRVAVMTSQMGFEALLHGKPVTCFGVPFYAGWGLTDDRCPTPERRTERSLEALVWGACAAAPRYVAPRTGALLDWKTGLAALDASPEATPIRPWRRLVARVADACRRRSR
jgi:capsular polysaccharide export protein